MSGSSTKKNCQASTDGNFGPAAKKLAAASLEALNSLKDEPAYSINAIGASVPEVAKVVASGGATGPQPPMLQLALQQHIKDSLRESFDRLIGPEALNREVLARNEAARESAIRGQNSSTIGARGNEIYGGDTIQGIFEDDVPFRHWGIPDY